VIQQIEIWEISLYVASAGRSSGWGFLEKEIEEGDLQGLEKRVLLRA
jgi:hypothetical protein